MTELRRAPEWRIDHWLNSPPLTLAGLRGRVVMATAFVSAPRSPRSSARTL